MSRWFVDKATDKVELEGGDWVDLKRKMTLGDREKLEAEVLDLEYRTEVSGGRVQRRREAPREVAATAKFRPYTVTLLLINIVDWSFKDDKGEKLPITRVVMEQMTPELADILLEAINTRNPL